MFTIERIIIDDFMPFESIDLDLTEFEGITLIEGRRGNTARSNGSGKSALIEAIVWCLFGRLVRPVRRDKGQAERVVRRDAERASVIVHLDIDGQKVVCQRNRSKRGMDFDVRGLVGSKTSMGVQEHLEAVLGHDFRSFTSMVVFAGQFSSFCRMTGPERQQLLERMLGLDEFDGAAERAGQRLEGIRTELESRERTINSMQVQLDQQLEMKQLSLRNSLRARATVRAKLRELREDVDYWSENCLSTFDSLLEYYKKAKDQRDEVGKQIVDMEDEIADIRKRLKEVQASLKKAEARLTILRHKEQESRKQISELRADQHPDTCSMCGQRWPQKDNVRLKAHLAELDAKRLEVETERRPIEAAALKHEEQIERDNQRIVDLTHQIRRLSTDVSRGAERAVLSKALESEANLEASQRTYLAFRTEHDEDEDLFDTTEFDTVIAELRLKLATERAHIDVAREMSTMLSFWRLGFSKAGLPSYLLDSSMPAINQTVAKLAAHLTNGELSVTFDSAAQKGTQSVFDVRVEYTDGGDDYDMTSNGEHTRVDIAVLFAIRELLVDRRRNPCSQIFLDEVFNGLDEAGTEAVVSMLRRFYPKLTVFLVTHDPSVKNLADGVVTVTKANAIASIA